MITRAGLAIAVLCLVSCASRAAAQHVSVATSGDCVDRAALEAALALELGATWSIVEDAPEVRVEVDAADCEAAVWSARVTDGSGVVLRGPAELAMAGFPPASRARIAALWIAEWLATLPSSPPQAPVPVPVPVPVPEAEAETETGTESDSETDTALAPAPALPPTPAAPQEPPVRVRFVALASFHQFPDTPASLGGGELGLQLVRGGELGLGVELSGGVEGGVQWTYDMLVLRGSLSAFALWAPTSWVEIDLGARASLEHLAEYTRHALRERLLGTLHGTLGGFVRTLLFVTRELAIAVDLELGGALAPITYSVEQPPGYELPTDWDELLGGFVFAARAGIVVQ